MSGSNVDESDTTTEQKPQRGPDEVFCTECGAVIKERAEVCPECGVRQQSKDAPVPQESQQAHNQAAKSTDNSNVDLTERRQYELEKIASKDKTTIILLGIFITPLGYWMIGKKGLALVNFITLNYFLLGWIIVPIHCNKMINDARKELRLAGVGGY